MGNNESWEDDALRLSIRRRKWLVARACKKEWYVPKDMKGALLVPHVMHGKHSFTSFLTLVGSEDRKQASFI